MAVTVADFYQAAREPCQLQLVAGEGGLTRRIHEQAINRPGLALAGFFKHFPFRRVQVLGLAENEYISALSGEQRCSSLRELFGSRIPCLIITRNRKLCQEIAGLAKECHVPVLRTPMITRVFINTATVLMERLMAPSVVAQGTMMDIMGTGVLIEGKPGIGKSESALALIRKGHALISDDVTVLRRMSDNTIIGVSPKVTRYHMEIHGLGIIHVPSLFGVGSVMDEDMLDLIVTLRHSKEIKDSDLGPASRSREIMGIQVPCVTIPVAPGRSLVDVIEVATLDEKLKRLGHDAAKELDQKLISAMSERAK